MPAYKTCPNIGNCPENRIYNDGCCERCNVTGIIERENHSLCGPESLPSNQTIGLVTEDNPFHDSCTNTEAIVGFTECRGLCDSYTYFNKSMYNLILIYLNQKFKFKSMMSFSKKNTQFIQTLIYFFESIRKLHESDIFM